MTGICTACGCESQDPALTWDDGSVFCRPCLKVYRVPAQTSAETARLNKRRQDALRWREQGLSNREIGERLGISHQAASQMIRRAKKAAGKA